MFRDINGYPNWIIEQTIEKVKNQNKMPRSTQLTTNTEENEHLLMLTYKGKVGETTLKSLRNTLNLPYQQITRTKLLERSWLQNLASKIKLANNSNMT